MISDAWLKKEPPAGPRLGMASIITNINNYHPVAVLVVARRQEEGEKEKRARKSL